MKRYLFWLCILAVCCFAQPYPPPEYNTGNTDPAVRHGNGQWSPNDCLKFDAKGQAVSTGGPCASGLPSGIVVMVIAGACPAGFDEVPQLSGRVVLGTLAANADIGTTGGADFVTPGGAVSQPTFTGSSASTSADSAGMPAGTVSQPTFTGTLNQSTSADGAGTPSGTVSQPTFTGDALAGHSHGVGTYATSAHTGTAVADHASHTHTYTDVLNHTHTVSVTDPGHTQDRKSVV